jgi:hypothetical protein
MKVYQIAGYPKDHYFVKTTPEWQELTQWMRKNEVDYLHQSSSPHGYGFSVRKNFEWFSLKWL